MSESASNLKEGQYGPYEYRLGDELRGERATIGKSLLDIQRDLRIRAAYLDAIENCDPTVFPNPGFIAGYIRSYARYLKLDPDEVYWRFCQESGFGGARAAAGIAQPQKGRKVAADARGAAASFRPTFPLGEARKRRLPDIPFAAIGSLVVLVALIGGLGYGGWVVLQNIQRVQFAPVEEVPVALAEIPTLEAPEAPGEPALPDLAQPVAATALVELYRQQELEVPILVPRDGPIAAIDPDRVGLLARARPETAVVAGMGDYRLDDLGALVPAAGEAQAGEPQVTVEEARPRLTVIAERPAWIRVYYANGTVIFERILESGEVYEVPETEEPPMIWAGNSGSVYVKIDETLHGPIGSGTRAARDIPLDAGTLADRFGAVGEVPSVISETISNLVRQADVLVQ
jgi:cytoskeleton protein RodZ